MNESHSSCLTYASVESRHIYGADDMCLLKLDRNAMVVDKAVLYKYHQRRFG